MEKEIKEQLDRAKKLYETGVDTEQQFINRRERILKKVKSGVEE